MRLAEFDGEKAWWTNRHESEQAWKVSASEIVANNYNLDIGNPNSPIEIHDDPEELLEKYKKSLNDVRELQDQLKLNLSKSIEK